MESTHTCRKHRSQVAKLRKNSTKITFTANNSANLFTQLHLDMLFVRVPSEDTMGVTRLILRYSTGSSSSLNGRTGVSRAQDPTKYLALVKRNI